jgi:lysyl-tRNA synthetase class 2
MAPEGGEQVVRLDENGEPLSKNALKKLLKAEKTAKEKAEKAAKNAANKPNTAEKEEEITDPSQYKANRENSVIQMQKDGIDVYPHKFPVDFRLPDFNTEFETKTTDGEKLEDKAVSVAGRIVSVRRQGKLYFYDLRGDGAKLQIMSDPRTYESEEEFTKIHKLLKNGDIVHFPTEIGLVESLFAHAALCQGRF